MACSYLDLGGVLLLAQEGGVEGGAEVAGHTARPDQPHHVLQAGKQYAQEAAELLNRLQELTAGSTEACKPGSPGTSCTTPGPPLICAAPAPQLHPKPFPASGAAPSSCRR